MKPFTPFRRRAGPSKPARLRLTYEGDVAEAAGLEAESVWVSDGLPFALLLDSVLNAHPEIGSRFPQGTLALEVNGMSPEPMTPLRDGDEVRIFAPEGAGEGDDGTGPVQFTCRPCPICGRRETLTVDAAALGFLLSGRLVQDAFPKMPPAEREMLVTGIHPACWLEGVVGCPQERGTP